MTTKKAAGGSIVFLGLTGVLSVISTVLYGGYLATRGVFGGRDDA